jgi:hypothetical protein
MRTNLPEVPPGLDVRLEYFLKQLRTEVFELKKLGGEEDPDDGGTDTSTDSGQPILESSATVLAGTAEGTATEDAWTTIASGVPAGARKVWLQGNVTGNADSNTGTLRIRTDSGSQEITLIELSEDFQNHWEDFLLDVTAGGEIDYIADTTAGAFTWKLRRIGYWT